MTEADFTTQSPPRQFNLIISNPPYVRHHHIPADAKLRLKRAVAAELGLELSGLAGLYCYFLLLADKWLAPDGLAIWLIPSEFMSVNYGTAVKEYLQRRVTLLRIHRFCPSDVQFSDALVSSAVVLFRKTRPAPDHAVAFTFGGSLGEPNTQGLVPAEQLLLRDKWTRFPAALADAKPKPEQTTLGDLFTIKRGLATGDNRFFVIPRAKAEELGIPAEYRRPILPSPRHLSESVIESGPDGYPLLERPLCLIDCDLPAGRLREQFPEFWRYLEEGRRQGIADGYLASRRTPWYSQERRDPAPFLCTYMGRASTANAGKPFRFLWNKSQATAANVYLLLYPKPLLERRLAKNPRLDGQVYETLSHITSQMFLGESRVYGGGLYKLEPKELARVSAKPILAAVRGLDADRQRKLFG